MPNFSAGPGALPEIVKQRIAGRMWPAAEGHGSALELSDRSEAGNGVLAEIERLTRSLLRVPAEFDVLLLPGGATHQFVSIAFSLRAITDRVSFVETDYWTARARAEMAQFVAVETCFDGAAHGYSQLPAAATLAHPRSDTVFLTSNNTAAGTRWRAIPRLGSRYQIVDMSSDLFASLPDYRHGDLFLACAQKHFGVAGISIVIVRRSMLDRLGDVDGYLSLSNWRDSRGRYNTFPMMLATVTLECLRYLDSEGGVAANHANCRRCSEALYAYLDESHLFSARVPRVEDRSPYNVSFIAGGAPSIVPYVVERAREDGLQGLKGHPSVGGLRASFYIGARLRDTAVLIDFLQRIEHETGARRPSLRAPLAAAGTGGMTTPGLAS
jgi:phosphoserine aminotransferase